MRTNGTPNNSNFRRGRFTPTRRGNPCKICGDTKGKCRETDSILLCMSFTDAWSASAIPGYKFIGSTKDGLWGKFVEDDGQNWTQQQREEWRRDIELKRQQRAASEAQRRSQSLPAKERDRLYQNLLNQLTLHPNDRADLERRGLTPEQIVAGGFRSVEQWQKLSEELFYQLPGVNLDGLSLNTQPGYLCPIRDIDGLIVGFQLRLRHAEQGGRYRWLTGATRKRPNGPTPHLPNGELPLAVHKPDTLKLSTIGMTEGTGVKPFITSQRLGQVVIGAAGGQFASSPHTLKITLAQLSAELGTKIINFYVDAGSISNYHVTRQYEQNWRLMEQWGYTIQVVWWEQVDKDAPDIDELTPQQLGQITYITTAKFLAIANDYSFGFSKLQEFQRSFQSLIGRLRPKPKGFGTPSKPKKALPQKVTLKYKPGNIPLPGTGQKPPLVEFKAGYRLLLLQELVEKGWHDILDTSQPGLGKSHDAGIAIPEAFGNERFWYFTRESRNPTTATIEANYTPVAVRNDGLVVDPTRKTPLGNPYLRWPQAHEEAMTEGNCFRTPLFRELQEKNIPNTQGCESPICQGCHLLHACRGSSGSGYGFRHERQESLKCDRLRAHPESAPTTEDFNFSQDGAFWDEAMQILEPMQSLSLKLTEFDQTMAQLELDLPEVHSCLKSVRTALRPILAGKIPQPHYGFSDSVVMEMLGTLPDNLAQMIQTVEDWEMNLLSLDFLAEKPDGIELKSVEQKFKSLARLANKKLRQDSYRETRQQVREEVSLRWLLAFLQAWQRCNGDWEKASFRIENGTLIIFWPSLRHSEVAKAMQWNCYQDATANRKYLAYVLNINPKTIIQIEQEIPKTDNLQVIQVNDLGLLGKNRSELAQSRVEALRKELKHRHPDIGFLDHKSQAQEGDGWWFNHNRGSNQFKELSAIASVGTPYQNIGHAQALYTCLTGNRDTNRDDPGFSGFIQWLTDAEFIQCAGRLRAHLRPNQQLTYYAITNYPLPTPLNAQVMEAAELTIEAGAPTQKAWYKIVTAAQAFWDDNGRVPTQKDLATATGVKQPHISKLASQFAGGWKRWIKIFQSLLDDSYRSGNISFPLDKEIQWVGESYLPLVADGTPEEIQKEVYLLVEVFGWTGWQQICQVAAVETLANLLVGWLRLLPIKEELEISIKQILFPWLIPSI